MAQWALSAGEINVAFYCGHIAKHTVETNDQVMIYGPVIMNAEVLCYKDDWEAVKQVGVNQGRQTEKELALKNWPQIEGFQDITQKAIMYAMEEGKVDAIVQDLKKAALHPQYETRPLSQTDYVSYVLVVDKEFAKTETFAEFIKSYNKAAERLNDPAYLAEKLGVDEAWTKEKQIKFLTLEESER